MLFDRWKGRYKIPNRPDFGRLLQCTEWTSARAAAHRDLTSEASIAELAELAAYCNHSDREAWGCNMKHIRLAMVCALAFAGLAACSHADYGVGGQRFHNYEDARAYVRASNERQLAEIQPLPLPIAGSATVVFPTCDYLENAAREDFPFMSDREVQQFAELQTGDRLWARVIERRNIYLR
jgi:hypothetical protein